MTGPRSQFLVLGFMPEFDCLSSELARRSQRPISAMPLWKRILLLQWGV